MKAFVVKAKILFFTIALICCVLISRAQSDSVTLKEEYQKEDTIALAFSDSVITFPNPCPTSYFVSSSAFTLKKGEGFYRNTYLLMNSAYFGLTNNISVGGGIEILSTVIEHRPIYFFETKAGFKIIDMVHVAGSLQYAHLPKIDSVSDRSTFMIANAMATLGTPEQQLTLNVGYGLKDGEWLKKPNITLSGATQVSNKISLLGECWLAPDREESSEGIPPDVETKVTYPYKFYAIYGTRYYLKKWIMVDLALINSKEIAKEIATGFPYADLIIKF